MRQKKVKPLKTKLLRKLRREAYWKLYGDKYQYQVFNRKDEVCDTLEGAKMVCDFYRRAYILNEVRKMRMGNVRRMY